ncbi:sugar phosphate isomerase/epimerase family protein [Tardisphaera saccharovorans]
MNFSICKIIFGSLKLNDFLGVAANLGFDGAEFGYDEAIAYFPDPQALDQVLSAKGLRWAATYWGAPWHLKSQKASLIEEAQKRARYMSEAGCTNLILGPPSRFDGYEENKENYLIQAVDTMTQVAQIMSAYKIKASLHNHYGTIIEGPDEINYAMQNTDDRLIGFCPDIAHLSFSGIDPLPFVQRYVKRVAHVHLKDAVRPGEFVPRNEKWDERLRDLGKGDLPLVQIVKLLKDHNYDGWISYEQDRPQNGESAMESARASKSYIDSVIKSSLI